MNEKAFKTLSKSEELKAKCCTSTAMVNGY